MAKTAKKPAKRKAAPKPKRKPGRPTKYSDVLVGRICRMIASGHSLRKICERKDMPSLRTVIYWLDARPAFQRQYARARKVQAELDVDDLRKIADEATPEEAQVAKLRIDVRKWNAARMKPKKYGDRLTTQIEGSDEHPLRLSVDDRPPEQMTDDEINREIAELEAVARGRKSGPQRGRKTPGGAEG